jgi:hypothetical protein
MSIEPRIALTTRLSREAAAALERMSTLWGRSKTATIEKLIRGADHAILGRLDGAERTRYLRSDLDHAGWVAICLQLVRDKADKDFKAVAAANGHYLEEIQ